MNMHSELFLEAFEGVADDILFAVKQRDLENGK
jgi:hypothetical protein